MKNTVTRGLIGAAILIASITIPNITRGQHNDAAIPTADAYNLFSCKWGSGNITWKSVNLTSTDLADTKDAIAHWNDVGANKFIDQSTGTTKLNYWSVSRSDVTWYGLMGEGTCSGSTWTGTNTIYLNDYKIAGNRIVATHVSAHETGHGIGLHHTQTGDTDGFGAVMWPNVNNRISPTLDDARGYKFMYNSKTSSSECTEWNTNGDVTYTGTCSGTNPALPMTMAITSPTSTSKAFATTTSSTTTLPSNGAMVMTVKVKPNTNGKYIMGAFTNTNIQSSTNRIAAIEMDTTGFYLTTYSSTGFVRTTITTIDPIVGTVYYLTLVIRDDQVSAAYVNKDDGGATNPPTFHGTPTFGNVQYSWSTPVFFGQSAYSTGTGQPLSSYTASEFYNLKLSFT